MVNRRKAFRAAYLELANVCNGNCAFCPGTTREPCFMDPFLFRRLAEETAPLAEIAYLHVMG
ncbi:MAG: radical SAM protein, partial [Victivallales bacterium]